MLKKLFNNLFKDNKGKTIPCEVTGDRCNDGINVNLPTIKRKIKEVVAVDEEVESIDLIRDENNEVVDVKFNNEPTVYNLIYEDDESEEVKEEVENNTDELSLTIEETKAVFNDEINIGKDDDILKL